MKKVKLANGNLKDVGDAYANYLIRKKRATLVDETADQLKADEVIKAKNEAKKLAETAKKAALAKAKEDKAAAGRQTKEKK